jgi:hypothetical protein
VTAPDVPHTANHTPGPWRTPVLSGDSLNSGNLTVWHEEQKIATVWNHHGKNADANARLIAAAPLMLEALVAREQWCRYDESEDGDVATGSAMYAKVVELIAAALAATRPAAEEAA